MRSGSTPRWRSTCPTRWTGSWAARDPPGLLRAASVAPDAWTAEAGDASMGKIVDNPTVGAIDDRAIDDSWESHGYGTVVPDPQAGDAGAGQPWRGGLPL